LAAEVALARDDFEGSDSKVHAPENLFTASELVVDDLDGLCDDAAKSTCGY
jgi:hypothetical protein